MHTGPRHGVLCDPLWVTPQRSRLGPWALSVQDVSTALPPSSSVLRDLAQLGKLKPVSLACAARLPACPPAPVPSERAPPCTVHPTVGVAPLCPLALLPLDVVVASSGPGLAVAASCRWEVDRGRVWNTPAVTARGPTGSQPCPLPTPVLLLDCIPHLIRGADLSSRGEMARWALISRSQERWGDWQGVCVAQGRWPQSPCGPRNGA